jgi:phage terminase Nu1 subunit (DNA packaging protein)
VAKKTVCKTRDELAKALGKSVRMVAMYLAEGMPGTPGHYVIEDCLTWVDARENKRSIRDADDLSEDDSDSPALERFRLARAQQEEIKLAKLRRELIEADAVRDWLQRFSLLMRGFGEKVAKVCPELCDDLDGVLSQAVEMLDGVEGGRSHEDGLADVSA